MRLWLLNSPVCWCPTSSGDPPTQALLFLSTLCGHEQPLHPDKAGPTDSALIQFVLQLVRKRILALALGELLLDY